jgi:4-hydroxybenzoate polyprenyltransferase/phosphoserine phosphatase
VNPATRTVEAPIPLAVDVDGTLLRTDLLQEAALQFTARYPLQTPLILGWLMQGKAALKTHLADRVDPGVASAPLRDEVMALVRAAQAEGRPVYLASASDRRYVEALAARIGGIAGVFATGDGTNLSGRAKAEQLTAAFGVGGYDYVGDSQVDFQVWRSARRVLAVARSDGFAARVKRTFPDAVIVASPRAKLRSYARAMRPHQWAKNTLVFLSVIAGHHFDAATILATTVAFVCFCAAASSAYILNDLLDLPSDREHPTKVNRPFASAMVPIANGLALSAALMTLAVGLSFILPLRFTLTLGAYVVTTLAYSFVLKRRPIIDVITLGGLYTLRVFAGLAATTAATSQWLLIFSLFLFLSLAVVKRCAELVERRQARKLSAAAAATASTTWRRCFRSLRRPDTARRWWSRSTSRARRWCRSMPTRAACGWSVRCCSIGSAASCCWPVGAS